MFLSSNMINAYQLHINYYLRLFNFFGMEVILPIFTVGVHQDFGFLSSDKYVSIHIKILDSYHPAESNQNLLFLDLLYVKNKSPEHAATLSSSRPLEGDPLTLAVRVGFMGLVTAGAPANRPATTINLSICSSATAEPPAACLANLGKGHMGILRRKFAGN
jgi:hypothetical protein